VTISGNTIDNTSGRTTRIRYMAFLIEVV